ncbi:MBL fold metallo-hydrolase [Bartonella tamiae]|uniref:Metallo-beta-lactamase domain-containing protein n=1 Tax=Bartonella tamiae Th239 TaxID=1094558 RepID=J0ZL96_9HYPH|nr:MBL fold metallo-hydrolase [Bartonella tamiae]EJF89178.1 hypothetical protein ME5_01729 [Bartonella tamiae Th239]EJF95419.1 hypothetical protein MEG_00152 [Bartonella tamiae Th307]
MGNLKTKTIIVTPFQQNCTILYDDESQKGVLVDPGGDWLKINNVITEMDVHIEEIWITHGHIDHVGAAMEAKEALNVRIIGSHIDDKVWMDTIVEINRNYNLPKVRNCIPDRWLEEGDQLHFSGHDFHIYHTPGHAPGHVIFVNKNAKFALLGDDLFRGSIGRTDLPYADYDVLMHSIREKILPLGDDIAFICGHGPSSTIGYERQNNPFLQSL